MMARAQMETVRFSVTSQCDGRMDEVRELFREYEAFLGIDLCFQDFEEELADLPGKYAPPGGALLLGWVEDRIEGCVALRKFGERVCEMKRLYVRPKFRGIGLGRHLAERIVEEAGTLGYERMKLDTFEFLDGAIHIYEDLGFRKTGSYYNNPHEKVQYWELDLGTSGE